MRGKRSFAGAKDTGRHCLFVYAHPDDEAIAVGGRMPHFSKARFIQVTDGAPADNIDGDHLHLSREAYRQQRAREVRSAFQVGGVTEVRHACLCVPDKEAALYLVALTQEVFAELWREPAEAVFTHPYEGGHADHDSCAFAVHSAVEMLRQIGRPAPAVVESPFYFEDESGFVAGRFLPHAGAGAEWTHELSSKERSRKQAIFSCFTTQADVLRDFRCDEERYRVAPPYDFTQRPATTRIYYERFIEGMTADRFCALAASARRELLAGMSALVQAA